MIQSNTDGLIYKLPKNDFDMFDKIVNDWEKRTKMTMEYDYITYMAQADVNNYIAVFGSQDLKFEDEKVENLDLKSLFGGIKLDLRDAKIEKDIVINTLSVFGGIDIYVPDDVKVKVSSTPFFGGVEVKRGKQSSKKEITIYLNSVCIFGGVDVK